MQGKKLQQQPRQVRVVEIKGVRGALGAPEETSGGGSGAGVSEEVLIRRQRIMRRAGP
jgi:hypothetical protein